MRALPFFLPCKPGLPRAVNTNAELRGLAGTNTPADVKEFIVLCTVDPQRHHVPLQHDSYGLPCSPLKPTQAAFSFKTGLLTLCNSPKNLTFTRYFPCYSKNWAKPIDGHRPILDLNHRDFVRGGLQIITFNNILTQCSTKLNNSTMLFNTAAGKLPPGSG